HFFWVWLPKPDSRLPVLSGGFPSLTSRRRGAMRPARRAKFPDGTGFEIHTLSLTTPATRDKPAPFPQPTRHGSLVACDRATDGANEVDISLEICSNRVLVEYVEGEAVQQPVENPEADLVATLLQCLSPERRRELADAAAQTRFIELLGMHH